MRDKLWIPALALVLLAGIIYAVETRKEVRTLDRQDELTTQTIDRMFGVVSRLEARVAGPLADQPVGDLPAQAAVELPSDGTKWHSVFIWPKDRLADRASAELAMRFRESPALQRLLQQTTVQQRIASDDDPLWKSKYSLYFGGSTPQFWLLKPDPATYPVCQPVYKVSGEHLPATGDAMAGDIREMMQRLCPKPKPPAVHETTTVNTTITIPDLTPDTEQPERNEPNLWWLIPVAIAGLALGVAIAWAKSRRGV